MSERREQGPEYVEAIGRTRKLLPTESDFKGKPGYWKKERPPSDPRGGYDWGFRHQPNEGGKLTRDGAMVKEMMAPFQNADAERMDKIQKRIPRVPQRDADGNVHYIDVVQADRVARENGWHHQLMRTRGGHAASTPMTRQETLEKGCAVLGHVYRAGSCQFCGCKSND